MLGFIGWEWDNDEGKLLEKSKKSDMFYVMDGINEAAYDIKNRVVAGDEGSNIINYYALDGSEKADNGIIKWKNATDIRLEEDFYKQATNYTINDARAHSGKEEFVEGVGPLRLLFDSNKNELFNESQLNIVVTNLIEHNSAHSFVGNEIFRRIISKDGNSCTIFGVSANFSGEYNVIGRELSGEDRYDKKEITNENTIFYILVMGPDWHVNQFSNKLVDWLKKDAAAKELTSDDFKKSDAEINKSLNSFCFWRENVSLSGGIGVTLIDYKVEPLYENERVEETDEYNNVKPDVKNNDNNNYSAKNVIPSFYTDNRKLAKKHLNKKNIVASLNVELTDLSKKIDNDVQKGYFVEGESLYLFNYNSYLKTDDFQDTAILNFFIPITVHESADITQLEKSISDGKRVLSADLQKADVYVYVEREEKNSDGDYEITNVWKSLREMLIEQEVKETSSETVEQEVEETDSETIEQEVEETDSETQKNEITQKNNNLLKDLNITTEVFIYKMEEQVEQEVEKTDGETQKSVNMEIMEGTPSPAGIAGGDTSDSEYNYLIDSTNNFEKLTEDKLTEAKLYLQLRVKIEGVKDFRKPIKQTIKSSRSKNSAVEYTFLDYPPVISIPIIISNDQNSPGTSNSTPKWVTAVSSNQISEDLDLRLKHTIGLESFYTALSANSFGKYEPGVGIFTISKVNFAIEK